MYRTKYLKAEKRINTKGGFQYLHAPIILIGSTYRKDESYYPEVFLEKYYIIEGV